MKKTVAMITLLALTTATMTGCGIVTAVPIGQEAQYTGATTFDASAEAADSWGAISSEITGKAEDLAGLMGAGTTKGDVYSVSFSGKVNEYNTDTPKGYLDITVDGVSEAVHVSVGKVFPGTTVRDAQTVKAYQDFTNQTEWSQYAKTINENVKTQVVEPLGDISDAAGKTATVVGCFSEDGSGTLVITPVSLVLE